MATKKSSGTTDVRIGISDSNQELHLEVEGAANEVLSEINAAIDGGKSVMLTDTKGRQTLVPHNKVAFVEVGTVPDRKVGFAN